MLKKIQMKTWGTFLKNIFKNINKKIKDRIAR